MDLRCTNCGDDLISLTKDADWTKLCHYIQFMLLEGYIQEATAQEMLNCLMTFKSFAFDWNDSKQDEKE